MASNEHQRVDHCFHEIDIGMLKHSIQNTESQLKKVLELLEKQAKLEEKSNQIEHMVISMDKRLRYVEAAVANHGGSAKWIDRIVWMFITALASGGLVFQFMGK